jgi:hypothetical protein
MGKGEGEEWWAKRFSQRQAKEVSLENVLLYFEVTGTRGR